jgi:hypothetical protein
MTETPTQANPRQLLADLIDAYAAAKATGNETLTRMAIQPIQQFLQSYEFVPVTSATFVGEELPEDE